VTEALLRRLDVATEAALEAGALLRSYVGGTLAIEEKRPGDLVTEADRASEDLILKILRRHFPEDVILTEESGQQGSLESTYAWMIDPLDGTTNFAHGYPFAAVSIGLLQGREPVMGVVCDVFRGDLFRAVQGMGATRNRQPIRVSTTAELSRSLLVTGFAYDRRETPDNNYAEFCHFTHLTQEYGAADLQLWIWPMWPPAQLDGYWERGLSPWDIAAGIVLVREAGGKVTAYDGSPVDVYSGRLLASNGWLHAALQEELAQVQPLPVSFPMRRDPRPAYQNRESSPVELN
jgi:Archaeal fructose-1,6-bisphosphatase and related enzymes of inositol monophosphatase family